jgi:hypothetical protein
MEKKNLFDVIHGFHHEQAKTLNSFDANVITTETLPFIRILKNL